MKMLQYRPEVECLNYGKGKVDYSGIIGNQYTFDAATTCYNSKEFTKKTAKDFIKMFLQLKHGTPLEFSWYCFKITDYSSINDFIPRAFSTFPYIYVSAYKDTSIPQTNGFKFIVSGNGRAFLDVLDYVYEHFDTMSILSQKLFSSMLNILNELNPDLFQKTSEKFPKDFSIVHIMNPESELATYEHKDLHAWRVFRISNVSVGMSRELNRHRTFSINERSTRYTGMNGDLCVFFDNDKIDIISKFMVSIYFKVCEVLYKYLKFRKYKNDVIRQILPLAIQTEEIVAGRLVHWKHFVMLRETVAAHPEIRSVAQKIKSYIP